MDDRMAQAAADMLVQKQVFGCCTNRLQPGGGWCRTHADGLKPAATITKAAYAADPSCAAMTIA